MTKLNRRTFLGAAAGFPVLATAASDVSLARADTISNFTAGETLKAYVKLLGNLKSSTVYTWFSGHLWGIAPDRTPVQLASIEGLAKHIWRVVGEQEFTQQGFDIGFFGDPISGEPIDELLNPFSGETVAPFHYRYGGGTRRYSEKGIQSGDHVAPFSMQWVVSGDQVWMDETLTGSRPNPIQLDEWPRESAGSTVRYGATTTYVTNTRDLVDHSRSSAPSTLFWSSINSWEPWLRMADAPGYVMWRGTGRKLSDLREAPGRILDYIQRTEPDYLANEVPWQGTQSTWTDFMQERKPAPVKPG